VGGGLGAQRRAGVPPGRTALAATGWIFLQFFFFCSPPGYHKTNGSSPHPGGGALRVPTRVHLRKASPAGRCVCLDTSRALCRPSTSTRAVSGAVAAAAAATIVRVVAGDTVGVVCADTRRFAGERDGGRQ